MCRVQMNPITWFSVELCNCFPLRLDKCKKGKNVYTYVGIVLFS